MHPLDVISVFRRHRLAIAAIAGGYLALFGLGILLTALVPELRPGGLGAINGDTGGPGIGTLIVDAYRSGDIALAALVTFGVNLLSASLLQTTVPSLAIPFLGVAITLGRGFSWGILFSPIGADDPGYALHLVTLLIEGAAYVLVGFAAWVHGRMWLQPARFDLPSRRAGYLAGLRATLAVYLPAIALLVIGAVYEAITVIVVIA